MYDYKYNYVNLTGFRLVDPNDEYTRDIIKEMYYYERDTELKLLYDKDYNTIPVWNNVFLIYIHFLHFIAENNYIIDIYKHYIIDFTKNYIIDIYW